MRDPRVVFHIRRGRIHAAKLTSPHASGIRSQPQPRESMLSHNIDPHRFHVPCASSCTLIAIYLVARYAFPARRLVWWWSSPWRPAPIPPSPPSPRLAESPSGCQGTTGERGQLGGRAELLRGPRPPLCKSAAAGASLRTPPIPGMGGTSPIRLVNLCVQTPPCINPPPRERQ
jgi:hypothetical protein